MQEDPTEVPCPFTFFILTLHEIDKDKARLSTMAGKEVEVHFRGNISTHVAKDLGRWARRNLGLKERTELGEFTQIVWKDQILGINHPLSWLLKEEQSNSPERTIPCTFCQNPLVAGPTAASSLAALGPFPFCYFCNDTPAWHHGWCCPQNPGSSMYRGRTHADYSQIWAKLVRQSIEMETAES